MDHLSIPVRDVERARVFYEAALAPLGYRARGHRAGVYAGFERPGAPVLYLHRGDAVGPAHLAFTAPGPEEVAAFHRAGLEAGGRDHGAPGPRPSYGPRYYAAFLLDPDGHNIEAVVGGVAPPAP